MDQWTVHYTIHYKKPPVLVQMVSTQYIVRTQCALTPIRAEDTGPGALGGFACARTAGKCSKSVMCTSSSAGYYRRYVQVDLWPHPFRAKTQTNQPTEVHTSYLTQAPGLSPLETSVALHCDQPWTRLQEPSVARERHSECMVMQASAGTGCKAKKGPK